MTSKAFIKKHAVPAYFALTLGAWHFLQGVFISGTYSGALPLALFVPMNFFAAVAQLTAGRTRGE
jgi:hypothetical protein